MWDACKLLWSLLIGLFRSRASLEAENLVLRQQIIVLRRIAPKRLCFSVLDRLIFVSVDRLFPDVRSALAVVRPETVIRWHRAGFRAYWRWRSRPRRGRPTVPVEIRQLIREMSLANPLWGAPRIHGELLKLGIDYRTDECSEWESGRIEARTGLRMMPTFPRSPLSFRTAGFPQYGWKAGCPSGAFPMIGGLSLLPACAVRRPVCIRPSCAS